MIWSNFKGFVLLDILHYRLIGQEVGHSFCMNDEHSCKDLGLYLVRELPSMLQAARLF